MTGGAFCIICGAEPPLSSDRMCETCLRERTVLSMIPERIQQDRCAKCSSYEVKGRWSKMSEDDISDMRVRENLVLEERALGASISFSSQIIDDRTIRLEVDVSGIIEGYEFSDSHSTLLQTSNAVCPSCTRKAGDYFEATVQLRSAGRKLDAQELADLRSTMDELIESMAL